MSKGNNEAPFSVTFRNHAGYDAYLFTVRGNDAEELEERLDDVVEDLLQKVQDVANMAQAIHIVTAGTDDEVGKKRAEKKGGKSGSKGRSTKGLKTCDHGVRERRSGKNSRGTWVGYFCPLEKGDPDQCDPIWEDGD